MFAGKLYDIKRMMGTAKYKQYVGVFDDRTELNNTDPFVLGKLNSLL